tara:strand:- start:1025 stop:2722 length:1698 start_codon:yes stop_codon:yes gene_type:complete
MAKIENFPVIAKANINADHVLYVVNQVADTDHKFVLNSIFPTIANVGSAGQAIHNNISNTSQFNLRKLAATSTSSGALTATTHADGHLLISLVEASLDLSNCDNSTSGFITSVDLAADAGATVLPVANGGTGLSTITANSVLIGNGTSNVSTVDMSTKGHLLVGDGTGSPSTLAVGTDGYILKADSTAVTGLSYLQTLPVENGGTGVTTLTANGVLIGNGTSAVTAVDLSTKGQILIGDGTGNPSALSVGTNGQRLVADSTAPNGVAWENNHLDLLDEFVMPSSTVLDINNNNIDLGTGFINGDGANNKGLSFNSSGQVFIGSGTPSLTEALNINGNIALTDTALIEPVSQSAGNGKTLKIHAGSSSAGSGAALVLAGGNSTGGGGNGGAVTIQGGEKEGGGTSGNITLSPVNDTNTGVTTGLVADALIVDPNLDATMRYGNMVFGTPTKGLVYTSRADATQSTDHSTTVTSNGAAGIITLAAVQLASGAEAQFRVSNSAAQSDSLILLTVESVDIGSSTDDSIIIAQIAQKADGNFDVALKNVGDATTDNNARKIHYLIINNSV